MFLFGLKIMKYIYVIKSFDIQGWVESHLIIAFETEDEARKYCKINSDDKKVIYTWDKVLIGKMAPPYPKKPKDIVLAP